MQTFSPIREKLNLQIAVKKIFSFIGNQVELVKAEFQRQIRSVQIIILTVCLLSACSAKPVVVEGTAMKPSFNDGDRILADKNLGELKRGDVITFLYPKDKSKWYLKRVIGLPGETIEIRAGKVFINGQIIDEPYVVEEYNQSKTSTPPKRIEEHQYFVMGDNRDNSSDSRYWGTVDEQLITGKYTMTYSKAE